MTESNELFELVRAAYVRGTEWMTENPGQYSYIEKAAYDYADKTTSALALRTPSEGEVVATLELARKFIEIEYADPSAEPDGEWLAPHAREIHRRICAALSPGKE